MEIKIPKSKTLNSHSLIELTEILNSTDQDDFYLNINPALYTDDRLNDLPDGVPQITLASNCIRKIIESFHSFSDSIKPLSDELWVLGTKGVSRNDPRVKKIARNFAIILDEQRENLDLEIEVFSFNASQGFKDYERLLAIHYACLKNSSETIDSLAIVFDISMNFIDAIRSTREFIEEINSLPRNFKEFKKSAKDYLETIDTLLYELILVSDFLDGFILRIKKYMTEN